MRVRHISGKRNALLKEFRRASRGYDLALVEGPKLLGEALAAGVEICATLVADTALAEFEGLLRSCSETGADVASAPEQLLSSVGDAVTHRGIVALAAPKKRDLSDLPLSDKPLLVVADSIQDPGNLGAIVRSAAAFGADALIALPGSSNPFGAKAIRGSAGSCFRLPIATPEVEELLSLMRALGIELIALDRRGGTPLTEYDFGKPCAIIVGSEGSGLSPELLGAAEILVCIQIASGVESLNAAVAASIALFEAARQRGETS